MRGAKPLVQSCALIFLAVAMAGAVSRAEETSTGRQKKPQEPEQLSLDFKGVDINELFKVLSEKSGTTIIATPKVTGRVSVFLNNLSFDEALDVVLTMQGLACEREGNIIKVMTTQEYTEMFGKSYKERKETKIVKILYAKPSAIATAITPLKSEVGKIIVDEPSGTLILIETPETLKTLEKTIKELDAPLETAVFDVNYANSSDLKTQLDGMITPGVGQIVIDTRSNKILVSDLPERLSKMRRVMAELDESSRQVLITGDIVQVALSDNYQQGIDWEALMHNGLFDFVGKFPLSSSSADYGKVSVGTLAKDNYTAVFTLLKEYGSTTVVSRPQIVVVNKEEAKILVGSKEAYVTSTQSQAESSTVTSENVSFVDVGVKLSVVPTINKEGFITMKIKPEVSSVREVLKTNAGSQIPIVETSETETVVKVKSGSVLMIGGLIKKSRERNSSGTPFLKDLPLVGGLFGTKQKRAVRNELIIFLSPTIISGDANTPDANAKQK
jgi:MSHA biogenesis protein MshL